MKKLILVLAILLLSTTAFAEDQFDKILKTEAHVVLEGYDTTYKDWVPLVTEVDGEEVPTRDSNLFLLGVTLELEEKYNTKIKCDDITLGEYDDYFSKRGKEEGGNVLMRKLIEDFYIEKGLLKQAACTSETKLCPDGTAVGRVSPDCKFAKCPDERGK